MAEPLYRRVVVKVSGESFAGGQPFGIDQSTIDRIASDLIAAQQLGVEIAVVVGGGNIFRGVEVSSRGVSRPTGDTMGMLATVMNCLALEAAIERQAVPARTLSAMVMPQVCELFTRATAHRYLSEGRIVLLAGGTGNPFFTTDTTAVLRGAEIGAAAVLKATNVDGVYSADPRRIRPPRGSSVSAIQRRSKAITRSWTRRPLRWRGRPRCLLSCFPSRSRDRSAPF